MNQQPAGPAGYKYIVVGSGAGGGTVAARLALAGHKVLLLEAGGDPLQTQSGGSVRLPEDYQVPCFHAFSTENDDMTWDYFVRHYSNSSQQQRDSKYYAEYDGKPVDGVLYPRAGTLGGCTAHNAMLTIYPHNQDWDDLATLTGDASWNAKNMRKYFQRLENCHHRPVYRWLNKILRWNPTRHGFGGWLVTEKALPKSAFKDDELLGVLEDSAKAALKQIEEPLKRAFWAVQSQFDPNDWRLVKDNAVGLYYPPLSTHRHARNGTREFLLEVAKKFPDRLVIELDALATRVLFDGQNRAIGVEYLKGRHLFRAHARPNEDPGEKREAFASGEVILCGGALNTPQLLMLSGIGPGDELRKHGIPVRVDLPGVGRNLQDRYEIGVVSRMKEDWEMLKGATFAKGDPPYDRWAAERKGVYTTNGALMTITKHSNAARPLPDLFIFALLAMFKGYFPGYSQLIPAHLNRLTWAILKAHTNNTGGKVLLRSSDPRDPPLVNFCYFDEGTGNWQEDLESVVDGVLFVRKLGEALGDFVEEEEIPGKTVQTREEIRQFIKDNAWGHHASCSCPIGPRESNGAVNGDFQVYGVNNLRVVDASVFPRIPGFFIVASVYMVAEKASDVILASDRH